MIEFFEQEYISLCLNGNYNAIVEYLKNFSDDKSRVLIEKYRAIFENGQYIIDTKDERIKDFLHHYEDYLKWALINQSTTEQ